MQPSLVPVAPPHECLDDNAASEFVSGSLAQSAITKVELHLASCRDCRALVAALAGDEADSNVITHKHEKVDGRDDSQVGKRPVLSIGDRVGRYLVLSSIGAGGMGVVFAAYDPQLDRKVALKLLRANLGANAKEARTRLKREAQAIAQLNHPNVVGVYDVGTTDEGDVYIAMEFVEGDTLTTWLRRWPRTWREILDVFHQAARGLMAAHSVGLLHRDFKPDNVLVGGDGRVRVTDFGLARSLFLDDSARGAATTQNALGPRSSQQTPAAGSPLQVDLTATGTVLGTPRYMPPEQLTGPSIDARADQFSFCVALYESLYTTHPLPGATSVSMLEHDERALPPPEGTKVPSSIARAVMRGL
ncbi:MAG TPA: serine/threonine-protein kinase, partial [Kofleriaceae bacterium]